MVSTRSTTLDEQQLHSRIQQHIERSTTPSPVRGPRRGDTLANPQYVNGSDSDNSEAATSRSASSRNHLGPPLYPEPDGTFANPFVFSSMMEAMAYAEQLRTRRGFEEVDFLPVEKADKVDASWASQPGNFYFDLISDDSDSDSSRTLGSQDTWSGSSTGSVDTGSSFKPSLAESDGSYGSSTESDNSSIEYPISLFQGENFFANIPLTYEILATLDQPSLVFQYAAFNGIDTGTLTDADFATLCEGTRRAFHALGPLRRRRAAERRIRRR